jgi:hypothetical protein
VAGSRAALAVVTLMLAASAANQPAVAQQTPARPASLTRPAAIATPRAVRPLDPWERRSRFVSLEAGARLARADAGRVPAESAQVVIDLFDGASVTAVFDRFDPNDTGITWVGHVPGQPGSLITLVYGSGVLAASIILPDASYTIRPAPRDPADSGSDADPVHVLVQVNRDGFAPEAPPIVPEFAPQALEAAAAIPTADTAEFIDAVIVYTALAEAWAGSRGGIVNWINVGVSETNSAYAASGVHHRVRLVHTERVAYLEVGNFSTNLNRLRAGATGLETVAALRNAYTADLVSMFVRPTEPATACGIAFLMTSVSTAFAPSGFSVVDAPCSSPNGTLAHEFGHNMGLRHDWYMDAGVTPFTYAHGYVNIEQRFRTIMSYPDACTARGVSCARLLAFSNPELTHLGQPMGIAGGTSTGCPTGNALNMSCDADERRALNDTAFVVANFREFSTLRPPLIVTHPQNQSAAPGQALTLQVAAEGLGPFTYQWYRGASPSVSNPIPGAVSPVYTFVPGADGIWLERWAYWVRVTNAIGGVNSNTAVVSMARPAADAGAPQRRAVDRDTAAERSSNAPGAVLWPRVFHWLFDPSRHQLGCRLAEIEAERAWATLSDRTDDPLAVMAALKQLKQALLVLQNPACRAAGGGGP